jgi:hypothetical protein
MKTMIKIARYQESHREAWRSLIINSRNGTFLHHRDYIDYHRQRFIDASLIFIRNEQLVGALPANLNGDVLESHGGLSYGGLVMAPSLHSWEVLPIFESIAKWCKHNGIQSFKYKSIPHIYHRISAEEDLYALQMIGAKVHRRDLSTSISLLGEPVNASKGRISSAIKAIRNGVTVRESEDFDSFMRIASDQLKLRYNTRPTHTAEEITLLHNLFPNNIKLLGGYIGNNLAGGIVLYLTDTVCHVQYIASTDEGKAIGLVDACISEALSKHAENRRWFDFGISTTELGKRFNQGLALFKETWGGRSIVFDQYSLSI